VIRVALVDDQHLVRAGLRALLERAEDITVVGDAEDGDAGVALAVAEHPDVVLMDIRMSHGRARRHPADRGRRTAACCPGRRFDYFRHR
jgi:DNA-binding NarL/FixJ family response regulator